MKNNVIKIFCCVLTLSILFSTSVYSVESTPTSYTFEYDEKSITIESENITFDQAKQIADTIAYGNESSTTYGILCIFGHKLSTTYAVETTHKEYSSAPRCVERTYEVTYCTRSSCDHSEATLISSIRVSCC